MSEKHSIVEILEHYGGQVPAPRGGWQKMKCPFHDDSHASSTVNIEENVFNCFGCGVKGDTYSIIIEREGVGFREAIKIAEGITGQSHNTLRTVRTSSRRVSSNERNHLTRRSYSPPGSGRRTINRTRTI